MGIVGKVWLCIKISGVDVVDNFIVAAAVALKNIKMAEHDLSKTIIPYLDRHLSFPLLTHLAETSLFPAEQIQLAQYELAKGTNMFDYSASLFQMVYPGEAVPAGMCVFLSSTRLKRWALIGLCLVLI